MADGSVSCLNAGQLLGFLKSLQDHRESGPEYLRRMTNFVSSYSHQTINLKNPAGATWTIKSVCDTIYGAKYDVVNGWGKFYLPEKVTMQVVGVVEGTSCPCDQLVLMTCENEKMYLFDGEELHYVASSLEQLSDEGITYPASKSYYKGEAFKHMTEEDWAKVKKGPVGKRLDKAHDKLVTSKKSKFLKNLKSTRLNTGVSS